MIINTNLASLSAATQLSESSASLSRSLSRLSSGSKITSPADDSAGLAVSMKLNAQLARISATMNNVGNAISFTQTQDGYVQKISDALSRMSELTVLAQDVSKTTSDRALYQLEFHALGAYISDVATKDFNGVSLFDGATLNVTTDSEGNTVTMQGINITSSTTYASIVTDDITTTSGAVLALANVKAAITQLAQDRANLGTSEETLTYVNDQLSTLKLNLSEANSRIVDVDVAEESTHYAKANILVQSGTAMLAQANSMPQSVLKLLG